jgi:peptidoglycan/xylan/chitin deacetylase (PgdA/CDA1 family)
MSAQVIQSHLTATVIKKIPILMYHSISDTTNPRFRAFTVSPASFAEQMAYLHQHDYTPITVTQFVRARLGEGSALPERPVVLTFDDGFEDFLTAALPILQQYHFTATLYISTAFINSTSRWMRYERETTRPMLTREQVVKVNASHIECGAHSHSHPQLDVLPRNVAWEEILHSKRVLEDLLGQEVFSFAYPFGYYTAQVRQLVQEAGFSSACAVKHAISSEMDDPFALARIMVHANATIEEFAASLVGRNSSPVAAVYRMYARARTPVWQLIRRSLASATQRSYKGRLAS